MNNEAIDKYKGRHSSIQDALVNYLGDGISGYIMSVLIQLHDSLVDGSDKEIKIYHTHKQFIDRYPWLTSGVITDRLKVIEGKRLMDISREGNPVKNYFKLNVKRIKKIINCSSCINSRNSRIVNSRKTRNKVKNITTIKNTKENTSKEVLRTSTKVRLIRKKINPVLKSVQSPVQKIKKIQKSVDSLNQPPMSASPTQNSVYNPKHNITTPVLSLYNNLTVIGFTKHREGTKSYFKTMDYLYELLHPEKYSPPYCVSKHNIPDEYKTKSWTVDELIETASFYMEHNQHKTHRNIKDFILAERFNEKSWSPLIATNKMMLAHKGLEYEGDEKRLFKELERLNFTNGIGPKEIKRMIKLLDLYCVNYTVNQGLHHLYYGNIVFAFGQFISEKIKQASFKSHYLLSEKVMQEFVDTYSERGVLVKNGYGY